MRHFSVERCDRISIRYKSSHHLILVETVQQQHRVAAEATAVVQLVSLHHDLFQASADAPSGLVDALTDLLGPVGQGICHPPAQVGLLGLEIHHPVGREGPAALEICHLVGQAGLLGLENHYRFGPEGLEGREIYYQAGQMAPLDLEKHHLLGQVGSVDLETYHLVCRVIPSDWASLGGQGIYHPTGQVENQHQIGLVALVGLDSPSVGGLVVDLESLHQQTEVAVLQPQASAVPALAPDC